MLDREPAARLRPAAQLQATAIARRFYLEGRTKVEIGDELGLSRFKVARILEEAVSSGLVRIEVSTPAHLDAPLSEALARRLGLESCVVVDIADAEPEGLRDQVGHVASDLLTEILDEDEVLGIAWGRAIAAMTASLDALPYCSVVQLCGALVGSTPAPSAVELVGRVARAVGGPFIAMHAPLVVSDARTAEALRREPEVAAAFSRFADVTTAVISIGAWSPGNSTVYEWLAPAERRRLARRGTCAEACGILFDDAGAPLADGLQDRVIGIPVEQLRSVPRVIGLVYGAAKAPAAEALARSGLVDTLVTDSTVASAVLNG